MNNVALSGGSGESRFKHLSPPRQRMVLMYRRAGFGTAFDLLIRNGEPVFDPPFRIVRRKKNTGNGTTPPEPTSDDFVLKIEWVEYFREMDAIGTGVILKTEISNGLPVMHEVEEVVAA